MEEFYQCHSVSDICDCRTYLVGERLTLADIALACTLLSLYQQVNYLQDYRDWRPAG